MSNGRCYDAFIILCLVMGEGTYLCRGDLKSQIGTWIRGIEKLKLTNKREKVCKESFERFAKYKIKLF